MQFKIYDLIVPNTKVPMHPGYTICGRPNTTCLVIGLNLFDNYFEVQVVTSDIPEYVGRKFNFRDCKYFMLKNLYTPRNNTIMLAPLT